MAREYCSKCGKLMTEGDINRIGVRMDFNIDRRTRWGKLFLRQLGKYAYASKGKIQFCWECWLDSLFGIN